MLNPWSWDSLVIPSTYSKGLCGEFTPGFFFFCVNLVDVQQECIEPGPNDIIMGNIGEANTLSNAEEKIFILFSHSTLAPVHSLRKNEKL